MPAPTWDPEHEKPENAAALERAMRETAPAAEIKLTLVEGEWLVRALLPAAMCARGSGFAY